MGEMRNAYNLKGRSHLGDLGVNGRIISKRILEKRDVRVLTGVNCLWIESSGELLWT
jgi:hypothetical protein